MKTGILAGDFDPVHNGHVNLVNNFFEELELDRVIILPKYCEPIGKGYAVSPSEHRLNMCNSAFSYDERIIVSDMEIKRAEEKEYEEEESYFEEDGNISDTVNKIKETYPEDSLYYLMGGDDFLKFRESRGWSKITDVAAIAVSPRNWDDDDLLEAEAATLRSYGAEVVVVPIDVREISSTSVRTAVRASDDISAMVPEDVSEYIWNNYLYYRD